MLCTNSTESKHANYYDTNLLKVKEKEALSFLDLSENSRQKLTIKSLKIRSWPVFYFLIVDFEQCLAFDEVVDLVLFLLTQINISPTWKPVS